MFNHTIHSFFPRKKWWGATLPRKSTLLCELEICYMCRSIYKFHVKLAGGIAPSLFDLPDIDEMNLPPTNKDFLKAHLSWYVCIGSTGKYYNINYLRIYTQPSSPLPPAPQNPRRP
ncbi:hypothetical protein MNV_2290016 [Candidatus Methanoperedens nitroreducens]|uniref:Uncharacterized protein n=1 Tax=Candidatus Methanoperedens nitratireducens TaxID=1392998 RepID=A0A284VP69_9EURY|nr:hypothetical protein MNV_2290016 [Candidatus Methanoperedens nitroreducens]